MGVVGVAAVSQVSGGFHLKVSLNTTSTRQLQKKSGAAGASIIWGECQAAVLSARYPNSC